MKEYTSYYNAARTHLGLQKDAPHRRPIERRGRIVTSDVLGRTPPSILSDLVFRMDRCLFGGHLSDDRLSKWRTEVFHLGK